MKVTIFGTSYVGLVTGVCLAEIGHEVVCVDIDQTKIDLLRQGRSPIHEPGLAELLEKNTRAGRLGFTTDGVQGVCHGELIIIAVGTPAAEDGSADLRHVKDVTHIIGRYLDHDCIVVNKSTVPIGTAEQVKNIIRNELDQRGVSINFTMASNPEFLKQGDAVADFMRGSRIVVGAEDVQTMEKMQLLYQPFISAGQKILGMSISSAELTKYAANAFLAAKISFINEMSRLAKSTGADIESIRLGIGTDPRIGEAFLRAGCGYGGSCFPKDVKALIKMADDHGCSSAILQAVEQVNNEQKLLLFECLKRYFHGDLNNKTFGVWGLAFKPGTDDIREAPSIALFELLWQAGSKVHAYDPAAMQIAENIYGERSDFVLCDSAYATLDNADGLVIVTEWDEFRNPDFELIKQKLNNKVIFDGRNLFDPNEMANIGIDYHCIGR